MRFFLIAVYVAVDNPNGNKLILANVLITLFVDGKRAVISGLRKFKNPPPSLFIRVIPEPVIDEIPF